MGLPVGAQQRALLDAPTFASAPKSLGGAGIGGWAVGDVAVASAIPCCHHANRRAPPVPSPDPIPSISP